MSATVEASKQPQRSHAASVSSSKSDMPDSPDGDKENSTPPEVAAAEVATTTDESRASSQEPQSITSVGSSSGHPPVDEKVRLLLIIGTTWGSIQ